MEQLYHPYVKKLNTNINHFVPIFESDDEEGTTTSTKPNKTTIKVISEYEDEEKIKGEKNNDDDQYENDRGNYNMVNTNNLDSDNG